MAKRPPVGINPAIPIPIQRELRKVAQYAFDAQAGADKANAALPGKVSKTQQDLLDVSQFVSKQVQANGKFPINLTGLLSGFTGVVSSAVGFTVQNGVITGVTGNGQRAFASTNRATGVTPAIALNGQGVPVTNSPIPNGTPSVTVLPGPSDPLSVINQLVLLNGVPYRFTAGLTGPVGYWALDVTGSPSISDTFANLSLYPAANYTVGTVFYATDLKVSYAVQIPTPTNVPTWIYYNGIAEDVLANIPAGLGTTDRGFLFRASDYLHNWEWTGSAWSLSAAAQSGFAGGLLPGSTVFSASGPPFGGTGALWHLCDGSTVNVSQENASVVATVLPTIANTYFVR